MIQRPTAPRSFYILGLSSLVLVLLGFYFETPILITLPILALGFFFAVINFSILFGLILLTLPFSMDRNIIPDFTLTVPTEPLMIILIGFVTFAFFYAKGIDKKFFKHTLFLLLTLHLVWIAITSFYSIEPFQSFKYFLAKTWYISTFLLVPSFIINKLSDLKKYFWIFFIPLILLVIYVTIKFAGYNFAFEMVNKPLSPFFLNHVVYSCTLALFLPFVGLCLLYYPKGSFKRNVLIFGFFLLLISVLITYTRTSWLSLPVAVVAYFIIRFQLLKPAVFLGVAGLILVLGFLLYDNNYLNYASKQGTKFHKEGIEKHLEATYKLEDASGMERVYRWVAAKNMIPEHLWLGTGANAFYPEYQKYTVNSFRTFISFNSEGSGPHNYFIMILVEQGIIGLLIFASLYFSLLFYAQKIYHRSKNILIKNSAMATALCLVILFIHLMLGDMIEIDKTGSFFFFSIALLIKLDNWDQESLQESTVISSAKRS